MRKQMCRAVAFVVIVAIVAATAGWLYRSTAQEQTSLPGAGAQGGKAVGESADVAALRKSPDAFTSAFNSGDAKLVASFWTPDGEYTSPEGEKLLGRAAIEKAYAEFFKNSPKATVEVKVETIRMLGKHTALEEGTLALKIPGDKSHGTSRYSVLHVREDNGWRMATVHEWVPDPAESITLKDIDWLVGEWTAKSSEAGLTIKFAWDEDKAFLRGRYSLKRDGKLANGTWIIGKNPEGGLRSWVFDGSGTFGESVWMQDEGHWMIDAAGKLTDGTEITSLNVLIPLGPDAFTWQAVERSANGAALPGTPPIRVTRVKNGK